MLNHCLEWYKWVLTNFDHDRQYVNTLIPPSHESAAVTVDCISRLSRPVRLSPHYTKYRLSIVSVNDVSKHAPVWRIRLWFHIHTSATLMSGVDLPNLDNVQYSFSVFNIIFWIIFCSLERGENNYSEITVSSITSTVEICGTIETENKAKYHTQKESWRTDHAIYCRNQHWSSVFQLWREISNLQNKHFSRFL